MEESSLDELISKLKWNTDEVELLVTIRKIINTKDMDLRKIIQPIDKDYWENAAIIFTLIPYKRVKIVIMELFRWLKDLNWPGANTILQLLYSFPKGKTIKYFEKSVEEAIKSNDLLWLDDLSYFTYSGKYCEEDFQDAEVYRTLYHHEKTIWGNR